MKNNNEKPLLGLEKSLNFLTANYCQTVNGDPNQYNDDPNQYKIVVPSFG